MRRFITTSTIAEILLVILFISLSSLKAKAENRYALLIGINKYIKPDADVPKNLLSRAEMFKDLNGCINDVDAISDVLKLRFGFSEGNISTLFDGQATREGILSSLEALRNKCNKGDVAFIFYSGHGSQYPNRLSPEADKLDETIVPADGIFIGKDIRDKEIASVFQKFIDKGIILTAVMDACHSGSIARGLDIEYKMVKPSTDTISDGKNYPQPEKNGALILSASQDFQTESARTYADNKWMSNLTKAFIDVLKLNKADLPASEFKDAIEARMRCLGFPQVPVLAANDLRRKQNLLGTASFKDEGMMAMLEKVLPDQSLLMEGGMASGIEEGSELVDKTGKFKIEITETTGLNQSKAKIISGNVAELKAGIPFKVKKFAYAPKHKLQVALPVINLNRVQYFSLLNDLSKIIQQKNIQIISDIKQKPFYTLYFNKEKWYLHFNDSDVAMDAPLKELSSHLLENKSILLQLPFYKEMYASVSKLIADQYSCVAQTDYGNADYFVSGTFDQNKLSYSVVKTLADVSGESDYPLRSDPFEVDTASEKNTSVKLCDVFYKLGKIKTWLTLESAVGNTNFPYHLSLKNKSTNEIMQNGTVTDGEKFQLILVKDKSAFTTDSISKRWVYVFYISEKGDIDVLFPISNDNIENRYPMKESAAEELLSGSEITVGAPFGIDHILMLTTEEPLADFNKLKQEGIATRAISSNPLDDLINQSNCRTRGINTVKTPDTWSLQKIRFKSVPK